jgi:hypothetical protein
MLLFSLDQAHWQVLLAHLRPISVLEAALACHLMEEVQKVVEAEEFLGEEAASRRNLLEYDKWLRTNGQVTRVVSWFVRRVDEGIVELDCWWQDIGI